MSSPVKGICIFATIRPKPEYFADAKSALEELIEPTLNEPGCSLFTSFESLDEANVLHLFEIFDHQEAIDAHYAMDYTQRVFVQYEKWLLTPVEIHHMSISSALSYRQFRQ